MDTKSASLLKNISELSTSCKQLSVASRKMFPINITHALQPLLVATQTSNYKSLMHTASTYQQYPDTKHPQMHNNTNRKLYLLIHTAPNSQQYFRYFFERNRFRFLLNFTYNPKLLSFSISETDSLILSGG
jgi:hypothetical protein